MCRLFYEGERRVEKKRDNGLVVYMEIGKASGYERVGPQTRKKRSRQWN